MKLIFRLGVSLAGCWLALAAGVDRVNGAESDRWAPFHALLSLRRAVEAEELLPSLAATGTPQEKAMAQAALAEAWLREGQYGRAEVLLSDVAKAVESGVTMADGDGWRGSLELARLAKTVPNQRVLRCEPGEVRFQRDSAGLNRLSVQIEGHVQEAVWDTGANLTTVTQSTAERLGLVLLAGTITVGTPTGVDVQAHLAVAKQLEVAKCRLEHVLVLVLPDANLTFPEAHYAIEAILGFPVIEALGTTRIEDEGRTTVGLPRLAEGAPNLRLHGLSPHVLVEIQGQTFELMLDSGATTSELHPDVLRRLPAPPVVRATGEQMIRGAAGASERFQAQAADLHLTLGEKLLFVEGLTISSAQSSAHGTQGVVGSDLLRLGGAYEINFHTLHLRFLRP